MAPSVRVVVYYVRLDGEVVADALNFDVEGIFQNFVGPFNVRITLAAILIIWFSHRLKWRLLQIRSNLEKLSISLSKLNLIHTLVFWE